MKYKEPVEKEFLRRKRGAGLKICSHACSYPFSLLSYLTCRFLFPLSLFSRLPGQVVRQSRGRAGGVGNVSEPVGVPCLGAVGLGHPRDRHRRGAQGAPQARPELFAGGELWGGGGGILEAKGRGFKLPFPEVTSTCAFFLD